MDSSGNAVVLVINCGSSSLKYELYKMPERESMGKGLVSRIGLEKGTISQKSDKTKMEREIAVPDHRSAMGFVLEALVDGEYGLIGDIAQISAIGHRVVHGGEDYSSSVVIDASVEKAIETNIELAPLHNPANLTGIQVCKEFFPKLRQVAVFDTAFHQTMPSYAYMYGLPREMYDKLRIRRYGFHGTSHRYVANRAYKTMLRDSRNTNLITCHLGNGASITAIEKGRSIDTSMGFTPLEGLIMGTRSGDIDPSIIPYLCDRGYDIKQINDILNKKSGMLGLTGLTSDMRDLCAAAAQGNKFAIEAIQIYTYRIRKYIGAYSAEMFKVDGLVFTGGIGENDADTRDQICSRLENLGMILDHDKNHALARGEEGIISTDYSPVTILCIPTNEELQIAIDTYDLVV